MVRAVHIIRYACDVCMCQFDVQHQCDTHEREHTIDEIHAERRRQRALTLLRAERQADSCDDVRANRPPIVDEDSAYEMTSSTHVTPPAFNEEPTPPLHNATDTPHNSSNSTHYQQTGGDDDTRSPVKMEHQQRTSSEELQSAITVTDNRRPRVDTDWTSMNAKHHAVRRRAVTSTGRYGRHECEYCHQAFATRQALECHVNRHTGARPFACDLCGATFTAFATLYNHKRYKHSEQLTCPYCNAHLKQMRMHVKQKHPERYEEYRHKHNIKEPATSVTTP